MSENKNQIQKEQVTQAIQIMEKDIADKIFNRVNEMEASNQLMFPPNYAVGNALKSAYLIIKATKSGKDSGYRPALEICTKESIANSLLDMVLQGLNPVKKQCYFIVYGKELQLSTSYFGHQVAVKSALPTVEDIYGVVIYQDDVIEIEIDERGKKKVTNHETKFENIDKPILGAYSVIINEGKVDYEIMTMKEIKISWSHGKTDKVQKEYPQEMAKRTVINRHCKRYMNTSDDSALMTAVEAYNRTVEAQYIDGEPTNQLELQNEVETKANQEVLTFEGETVEVPNEPTLAEEPKQGPPF